MGGAEGMWHARVKTGIRTRLLTSYSNRGLVGKCRIGKATKAQFGRIKDELRTVKGPRDGEY